MTDRREQILDAAVQLAAEGGHGALTVRRVAARAGIGASTLRHYFPTQRALRQAVVRGTFDRLLNDLRITDTAVPPARRLAECLGQFLPDDDAVSAQLHGWLGAYASAADPGGAGEGADMLAVMGQHARERADAWLAVLESEGALRHPDRERHATVLFAVLDGLCLGFVPADSRMTADLARGILDDVIDRMVIIPTTEHGGSS